MDLSNHGSRTRWIAIRRLVCAAQAGDQRAYEQLVAELRGLLKKTAGRYARGHHSSVPITSECFADYYQGALLGLHLAVMRWNEDEAAKRGVGSFLSFAVNWIRHGCQRHGDCGLVAVPVWKQADTKQFLRSFDAPAFRCSDDPEPTPLLALAPAPDDTESAVIAADASARVRSALARLPMPARARDVLRGRLLDDESRAELAKRWGVSIEMIRRVYQQHFPGAMAALRRDLALAA